MESSSINPGKPYKHLIQFNDNIKNELEKNFHPKSIEINQYQDLATDFYSKSYIKEWCKNTMPFYALNEIGVIIEPVIVNKSQNIIFIPESYDQFIIDQDILISHHLSYISKEERVHKRKIYGIYHNRWQYETTYINAILSDRMKFISKANHENSFVLCWHEDQKNYWHFTFDAAFRLFALQQYLDDKELSKISFLVVGKDLNNFQKEIFKALLGRSFVYDFYPNGCTISNCWMVPTTNSSTMNFNLLNSYSSSLVKGFNQLTNNFYPKSFEQGLSLTSKPTRLYILRGKTRNGRLILNELELIELVKKYNFTIIDPGTMSVQDQICLFMNANMIIGANGAAFTNIIYMQKGLIIELAHHTYNSISIFLLTKGKNINYIRIRSGNNQYDSIPHHTNFSCDLPKLGRALEKFCLININ